MIGEAAARLGITLTPFVVEQPVSEAAYRRAFVAIVNGHQNAVLPGRSNENNISGLQIDDKFEHDRPLGITIPPKLMVFATEFIE